MKSFRAIGFITILNIIILPVIAISSDVTRQYIDQYKSIAISEMERVGIPASIKMAQAILESNSGRSRLSRQSNNHFGIKCGKSWKGREVYHEDDDYDNDGLLTKSCFRAFDDPAESFYEHSAFLANPYSKRYKFLFQLDIYDYKAWAKGLKKAGYATDKAYPQKLIKLIEKYRLYELDLGIIPIDDYRDQLATNTSQPKEVKENHEPNNRTISSLPKTRSKVGVHRVQKGETMRAIAMRYGIETRTLYMRNRLPFGSMPAAGEELVIHHTIHFDRVPKKSSIKNEPTAVWTSEITITGQ